MSFKPIPCCFKEQLTNTAVTKMFGHDRAHLSRRLVLNHLLCGHLANELLDVGRIWQRLTSVRAKSCDFVPRRFGDSFAICLEVDAGEFLLDQRTHLARSPSLTHFLCGHLA